ncbi:MAG: hypothetical protein ACYSYV_09650 [Planctomycetota bacterium]|jgi:hypothetical protein
MPGKIIPSIAAAIFILAGCAPDIREPMDICPGKGSAVEALAALQSHSQNMVSLKANGQCRLEYYVEGKKKPQRENFSVRLWVNPPAEIYLQGDKALVPKAIVLGSNEREFWLAIRPKEISIYCWGNWSEQGSSEGPLMNPKTLLEALGIGEVDVEQDWSLSNEGAFDILEKRERGVTTKKIYIYSCEYQVRRIEFFDQEGQAVASAELGKYKEVSEGFSVPALIRVTTHAPDNAEDSLSITLDLKSIKPAEITERRRELLFKRRPPRGFKHVRKIVNGKWIEEPQ